MRDTIRIKVHRVAGFKPSSEVVVSIHDRFWQRRLKDAERDNCCEEVKKQRSRPRRPARVEAPRTKEKT